jgi:hypothetical protein
VTFLRQFASDIRCFAHHMDEAERNRAWMQCPKCGEIVAPLESGTVLVAWYGCDH